MKEGRFTSAQLHANPPSIRTRTGMAIRSREIPVFSLSKKSSSRPGSAESPRSHFSVLFVCVENSFRSVLSEALFNARAPKGWLAESAGVQPGPAINPVVVDLLHEVGIEIGHKTPRLVSSDMIVHASRVITFGCLDRCPGGASKKSEDWPIPGATGKTWNELQDIRDQLSQKVSNLIKEIEQGRIRILSTQQPNDS